VRAGRGRALGVPLHHLHRGPGSPLGVSLVGLRGVSRGHPAGRGTA
jgi:hypothetical protein